jgi:YVTN family beta-propeller protein
LPSVLTTVSVGSNPQGIAVRPDGAFAYVANRLGDSISVINTATNAVTATINLPSGAGPGFLAITPDGTRAFVANQFNNTVSVVDLNTRTVVATITGLSSPQGVAITRDGTRAYVTNNGNGTVTVINVGNNTILGTVASAGTSPVGIAIDPESQQAYVADAAAGSTGVKVVGVHNGGSLLTVDPGTDLVSNGSNPVVTATGATIHLGRNAVSAFGTLTVKSPVLVLGSTALDAIGSILNVSRPYDGASTPGLTDTTGSVSADALISATGGSLTSFLGHIVNVGGSFGGEAHLALWRPLFSSSGTTLSSYFHFLRLADGAQFCASCRSRAGQGPSAPAGPAPSSGCTRCGTSWGRC